MRTAVKYRLGIVEHMQQQKVRMCECARTLNVRTYVRVRVRVRSRLRGDMYALARASVTPTMPRPGPDGGHVYHATCARSVLLAAPWRRDQAHIVGLVWPLVSL